MLRSMLVCLAGLAAGASLAGEIPTQAPARALFLHYRWHKDGAITLVSQNEVPSRLKPSRTSAARGRAAEGGRPAPELPAQGADRPWYSYALVSARGEVLAETRLPDPYQVRVEFQEEGDSRLRSQVARQDSGDVFLRISDSEARSIRFFQWHPQAPAGALAKGASQAGAPAAGPEPSARTFLAEFPLP